MNDTGRRRSVVRAGEEEEDRIRDVIVRVVVQALRSRATRCPDLFLNGPLQIAEPRWWVDMANAALADEDLGTWRVWLVQARAVDDPHLGGWRPDIILTVDLVDRALGRGLSHSVSVRTVIETLGPAMRLRIDPHQARQAAAYAPPRDAGGLRQRSGRYYGTFSMMGWDPGCERYGDRSVESPNLEESSRIGPTETSAPPPDYAVAELVALARAGQLEAFEELARLLMPVEEVEACWQGTRARLGFTDAPAQIPLANAGRVCHTEEGAPG